MERRHKIYAPGISKSKKRALWTGLVSEFLSSGMKYRNFCEQHGLDRDQLGYYVGKYRQNQRKQSNASPSFSEVKLATEPAMSLSIESESAEPVVVTVGSYEMKLTAGTDMNLDREVLSMLSSLSC